MPEKLPLRFDDAPELVSMETPLHRYIDRLNVTGADYITSDIEDVSGELKLLDDHYSLNTNSRLSSRKIAPLVDFLTLYNPAVDIAVQSNPAPSALVWGSLKALLLTARTTVRCTQIIHDTLLDIAEILCVPVHSDLIFQHDPKVSETLAELYYEILTLLEDLRLACSRTAFKIVRNLLKPLDADLNNHFQRLSIAFAKFEKEATLALSRDPEVYAVKPSYESEDLSVTVKVDAVVSVRCVDPSEIRENILSWLCPSDYNATLRQACAKRAADTGDWLLTDTTFQRWSKSSENSSDPVLWCYGAPGCGKTVLSATAVQYLRSTGGERPTIYFQCSSTDKWRQSRDAINISLLAQLVDHSVNIPEALLSAYTLAERYGRCRISASDRISDLVMDVLRETPNLNIIIDGVDECEAEEIPEILQFFSTLARKLRSVRVLFFSRDILPIRKELDTGPSIHISTDSTKRDIDLYLRDAISTLPCSESHLKQYVYSVLSKRAAGMFLFARLGIETLRASLNTQEMLASLDGLPAGLHNVYSQVVERLASEPPLRQDLARQVFRWVCRSTRPLTWPELRCALSWDRKRKVFDENIAPFKDSVLAVCCPLVEHRPDSDTFQLAHLSIYEYFHDQSNLSRLSSGAATFILKENKSHAELAEATLTYLGIGETAESINVDPKKYPLAKYATENWCFHLSLSPYKERLHRQYTRFVSSESRRSTWITRSLLSEDIPFPIHRISKLQKLVRTWAKQSGNPGQLDTEDLIDIQKALFRLDEFQQSQRRIGGQKNINTISNFERSMIIRDLARIYTMGGQISYGVRVFEEEVTKTGGMNSGKASKTWLLNSLGILYDQQGRFQLAEAIQRQALAVQLRFLPRDHLDIIITINELGRVCRHLQKYEEAESLHLRALRTLQALFPNTDQHVIWTQNALARCYRKRGQASLALDLHTQAYNSMICTLGAKHPHAIWTLSDMARCVRQMGRIEEALELRKVVLEQRVEVYGRRHPDTLWAMGSLGLVYEALGSMVEALRCHTEAYEGQVEIWGSEHPHAKWSLMALCRAGYSC
ncbi:ankyrin repeat-containing domain protein [Rutstroemia sp. NJR-2017a WRK4]|nr:ankyrin repeat-containing domain protein [Rutstroemia sp. NJR-2017a WRK4]